MKKHLALFVKLALTGAILWVLTQKVDLGEALRRIGAGDPLLLAGVVAVILVQFPLAGQRWRSVLRALGVEWPARPLMLFFWMGSFFNLVLPGAVGGDAIRLWKAHRSGLALRPAINGVMLERVIVLETLLLLASATLPLLALAGHQVPAPWAFPLLAALGALGLGVLAALDRLPLPHRFRDTAVVRGLSGLSSDTRRLVFSPAHLGVAAFWCMLGHVNLSLAVWVAARALDVPVDLAHCLALVPPVILVMSLPISIAGWGARELAMVTALGVVGVAPESALAISVAYGLAATVSGLPGGLLWFADRRRGAADAGDARSA